MDFNLKGRFWAGNIYYQFESICQDVDEFVGKDTMKFVENQVQSVGMTVKKFYSNVVQDILPLPGDNVKPEQQLADGKQVDMRDHVSVTGIRTNSTCVNEYPLFMDQGSMHALRNSNASLPIEFDHIMQFCKPPYTDPSPEAETCLPLREYGDATIWNGEDSGVEENSTGDSIPVIANSSLENEIFSGRFDEDHKNSTLSLSSSPAYAAHEETCLHLREYGDATIRNGEDSGVEENTTRDSIPVTANSSLVNEIFSGRAGEDHKNSTLTLSSSPAFAAHEETCLPLREYGDATIWDGKDIGAEENIMRDSMPVTANSSLENEIFSGRSGKDHKNSTLSLASSPAFASHEEICLPLREYDDATIWNGKDSGAEENITRDSIPVTANSSVKNEIFSGKSGEDPRNSTLSLSSSPAFAACEEGFTIIKEETNHQRGNKGLSLSDDTECLSDFPSTVCLSKSKLTTVDDRYSDEKESLSSSSVASAPKINNNNSLLMDSTLPSACDVNSRVLQEERALCDSFSNKDESFNVSTFVHSSEHVFSCFSSNKKTKEMVNMSSTCCTSSMSSSIMGSTSADFVKKTENIFHSHCECDGFTYNISASSSIATADETRAVDALPDFLNLASNDNNSSQTDGSEIVIDSSESRNEQLYKDGHSKIEISPSGTANTYESRVRGGDRDMETIDLSPNVEHEGRTVVLGSNFIHAASYRRRNFRYYKKLIQDAFTSRKRLSKEYEHLAILYGDIDKESNQHFEPSSEPSFPNTAVHVVETQLSQEMRDTEWELL